MPDIFFYFYNVGLTETFIFGPILRQKYTYINQLVVSSSKLIIN